MFALAWTGAALGLRAALPERADIPVISAKLAVLAEQGGAVDTLFLGSSRVFHQMDPRVFDARMAELGLQTHSYNLAADGMNFPETFYVLERALPLVPKLKLVIFEAGNMQHVDNWIFAEGSLRTYYWRDLAQTWTLSRSIWRSPGEPPLKPAEKVGRIWHQIDLMLENLASLGRGADWLQTRCRIQSPRRPEAVPEGGYEAVNRRMSTGHLQIFQERMKTKQLIRDLPLREDPELQARFDRLAAELRARGIEPCFVLLPAFRKDRPVVPANVGERPVLVADFDNPAVYPDLFREKHYYDTAHLNATGSVLFTRKVAEAVQQHLNTLR